MAKAAAGLLVDSKIPVVGSVAVVDILFLEFPSVVAVAVAEIMEMVVTEEVLMDLIFQNFSLVEKMIPQNVDLLVLKKHYKDKASLAQMIYRTSKKFLE